MRREFHYYARITTDALALIYILVTGPSLAMASARAAVVFTPSP